MKRISCLLVLAMTLCSCSRELVLRSECLQVSMDRNDAHLTVTDLRCGRQWEQASDAAVRVLRASVKDGCIKASLQGDFPFEVCVSLNDASVSYTISAPQDQPMDTLAFPSAIRVQDDSYYILETDGEGMLLAVNDLDYPCGDGIAYFCGGGLSMAWKGIVDANLDAGVQAVLETPFDACLRTFVQPSEGLLSFKTVWLANMQNFGYERKATFNFFDKGGYVAQAKKYREYVWKKNGVVSLKEQAQTYPVINDLVGSTQVFTWDDGRQESVLSQMQQKGIRSLFVFWDANHRPYPKPGYDNFIRSLGYRAGGYELFTDIHLCDTAMYVHDYLGPNRHRHGVYPGLFNELSARKADGGTYSNQFGTYICPATVKPYMYAKLDRMMSEYPHDAIFLDVYQANGLHECYSPDHRIDRRGYAESIIRNYKSIRERYNTVMGGEWGAEFAIPYSIFNQGMMTLQRPWWEGEMMDPGSEFFFGDWKNNERPSIHVTNCKAGPSYYKYCLNEAIRVPLYQLVYHDAVITTWRWEDGNPRYPELWHKKDLYNMLYGTVPYWSITKGLWEESMEKYISSNKMVTPWLREIGMDEMVSHEFLSEDRTLQKSVFSGGKAIIVDFVKGTFEIIEEK